MTLGMRTADLVVLLGYLLGIVAFGSWFVRRSRTTKEFVVAGGAVPGWAVGLSIFGTFLSSNTFPGVPGKAYAENWNALVFSFSLPIAAWLASRYFVPFYRRGEAISAYEHLELRFGPWARTYAVVCYLLTQLARMGTVMFGMALALRPLTGWDMQTIILITGGAATIYTLLGGIDAVIWTDVVQSIVLLGGSIVALIIILLGMPDGPQQAIAIAAEAGKFSLGSFSLDLTTSTFWVVLLYGLFINLNNFGIDQNYVQRYHAARSHREAVRSVWLGAMLYLPVSTMFFFIGSSLFSFYQTHPDDLQALRRQVAEHRLASGGVNGVDPSIEAVDANLTDRDVGDRAFPRFIAGRLPPGLAGLVIAAILAAAMSSVDSSLNSSATVMLYDIYRRYVRPGVDDRGSMRFLHVATFLWGAAGTGAALAMLNVQSVLDAWWKLSGVFAGGMLGLFLLGLMNRRAGSRAAAVAVFIGVAVILWMTLSRDSRLPPVLWNPFHDHLIIVFGTAVILVAGFIAGRLMYNQGRVQ